MEQNVDASVPMAPVAENNKQNSGSGLKITAAIASIVAVCGVGFGVYGVMQVSDKDSQISDLKKQIGELSVVKSDSDKKEEESKPDSTKISMTDVSSFKSFSDNLIKFCNSIT